MGLQLIVALLLVACACTNAFTGRGAWSKVSVSFYPCGATCVQILILAFAFQSSQTTRQMAEPDLLGEEMKEFSEVCNSTIAAVI
jgi:hypothetical protein